MQKISAILSKRPKLEASTSKSHPEWEVADEFAKYVGLETPYALFLFKRFGRDRVLSYRSWFKDTPRDPKRFKGLVYWKLNQTVESKQTIK